MEKWDANCRAAHQQRQQPGDLAAAHAPRNTSGRCAVRHRHRRAPARLLRPPHLRRCQLPTDLHPGDRLAFAGDAPHIYRNGPEASELKEIPGLSRPCSRNSKGALGDFDRRERASRQRRAVSWSGAPGVFQGLRRRIAVGRLGHGVGGLVRPGSGGAAQRAECRSDEEVDLCLRLVRRGL